MNPIKITLISLLLSWSTIVKSQQKTYSIINYGAKFDLRFNNMSSIQKAIDAAAAAGGGKVLIPEGVFVTGPLVLKTGVELHLDDNAILMGSNKRLDYPNNRLAVISAIGQQHIAITGNGIIDGNGRELVENSLKLLREGVIEDSEYLIKRPKGNRTSIFSFSNCSDILIKDITLKNAAAWVQNYTTCSNLVIDHITVESTAYWNNDGVDLVDCKNVKLMNSFINSADDGICLKSDNSNAMCENILVTDCTVRSSASAFKFGTGSVGGFKDITVRNLNVYDTFRSAIALESADGAIIENIDIRNVVAKNTGNAIFIRLGHRNKDDRYGSINRVYIANLKADIPYGKPDIGYPVEGPPAKTGTHNLLPAIIVGIPGHSVGNVTLENIEISYGGKANKDPAYIGTDSLDKIPENIAGYPEFSMFGELPAYGLYVRHATNIIMKNVKFKLVESDFRPAIIFDDVKSIKIQGLNLPVDTTLPALIFNHVGATFITDSLAAGSIYNIKKQ